MSNLGGMVRGEICRRRWAIKQRHSDAVEPIWECGIAKQCPFRSTLQLGRDIYTTPDKFRIGRRGKPRSHFPQRHSSYLSCAASLLFGLKFWREPLQSKQCTDNPSVVLPAGLLCLQRWPKKSVRVTSTRSAWRGPPGQRQARYAAIANTLSRPMVLPRIPTALNAQSLSFDFLLSREGRIPRGGVSIKISVDPTSLPLVCIDAFFFNLSQAGARCMQLE